MAQVDQLSPLSLHARRYRLDRGGAPLNPTSISSTPVSKILDTSRTTRASCFAAARASRFLRHRGAFRSASTSDRRFSREPWQDAGDGVLDGRHCRIQEAGGWDGYGLSDGDGHGDARRSETGTRREMRVGKRPRLRSRVRQKTRPRSTRGRSSARGRLRS